MKKFLLMKGTIEVYYAEKNLITDGITLKNKIRQPEVVERFSDKEEALEKLQSFESTAALMPGCMGGMYYVTEYYVKDEENGDILSFAVMGELDDE